ncbi:helix-turn-helix domain-containing protein [Agreia bicolorata]|uniref:Schlafen AlbA-2 domain-containing protein n=1 Tax=Agreia bicolorata TaxID=110935 RepID=A0ABR5CGD4_9MICO|nr:ATP-binding protein [Agreia bicolorata]KJC64681.1 hypothetical protein TZ00_10200 [Agreia bicolorata]
MLNDEQLAAIIDVGYEQRGVEFKSAGGRSDRSFLANVARATIALVNQRDGGHLVIGLSEKDIDDAASGLSTEQLEQWLSFDDVSDQINAYADPPLQIQLAQVQLPNGRAVVVVEVSEFAEVPVLSKKDYPNRIRARQLYTRSMAKPESSAALTQNELREVITLATERQLARFLETARRAGLGVRHPAAASAREQFDEQLSRALAGGFHLDQALPQFLTTIRPAVFDPRQIPFPRATARGPECRRQTTRVAFSIRAESHLWKRLGGRTGFQHASRDVAVL